MTMGELASMFNARKQDRRQPHGGPDAGLAARRLVRFHQSYLGQPLAQYAQPECRDALSGPLPDGVRQDFSVGRGTDCSVRTGRRGFHRRARTGRPISISGRSRGCAPTPRASRPADSVFKGVKVEGVRFVITNRELLDATRLGLELGGGYRETLSRQSSISAGTRS